jgi:hypothetical protein
MLHCFLISLYRIQGANRAGSFHPILHLEGRRFVEDSGSINPSTKEGDDTVEVSNDS